MLSFCCRVFEVFEFDYKYVSVTFVQQKVSALCLGGEVNVSVTIA